tara:strand:+ start:16150 stop:16587 length:438 start_codon:yes stop_codon:yes gene_type:complete
MSQQLLNSIQSKHKLKHLGFTLIELLITVAIVGILAGVAYPSYVDYVMRSNRSEGQRELLRLANVEEQGFIDFRSYTNDMTDLGMSTDPYVTESGNYSIDAVIANSGSTFVLTAIAQNTQANDSGCTSLTINEVGQKTPASCWEK